METAVADLVARLLDELENAPAPDLIEDFAARIPVEVTVDGSAFGGLTNRNVIIGGFITPALEGVRLIAEVSESILDIPQHSMPTGFVE